MRVIVTARHTLSPQYQSTLTRLVAILGVISKNPSNPRFDQYIFESIAALLRFVGGNDASTVPVFEQTLFGSFTIILQQDIDRASFSISVLPFLISCRIHSLCVPSPRANARVAPGWHPRRISVTLALPINTKCLATKRERSRSRQAAHRLPFARRCPNGHQRPDRVGTGCCSTASDTIQTKRFLGIRAPASSGPICSSVCTMRIALFMI